MKTIYSLPKCKLQDEYKTEFMKGVSDKIWQALKKIIALRFMLKNRKHSKRSKGERLNWTNLSGDKKAVGKDFSLEDRFLKPARIGKKQSSKIAVNSNEKLLVP